MCEEVVLAVVLLVFVVVVFVLVVVVVVVGWVGGENITDNWCHLT